MRTSTLIGLLCIVLGVGVLAGHFFFHHDFHVFPTSVGVGVFILGCLLVAPTDVGSALGKVLEGVKTLLPWKRDGGGPTA